MDVNPVCVNTQKFVQNLNLRREPLFAAGLQRCHSARDPPSPLTGGAGAAMAARARGARVAMETLVGRASAAAAAAAAPSAALGATCGRAAGAAARKVDGRARARERASERSSPIGYARGFAAQALGRGGAARAASLGPEHAHARAQAPAYGAQARSYAAAATRDEEVDDPYKVLGVSRSATPAELKKAYRREALKWHPDRHSNDSAAERAAAEAKFKRASEAYAIATDPAARARWERSRAADAAARQRRAQWESQQRQSQRSGAQQQQQRGGNDYQVRTPRLQPRALACGRARACSDACRHLAL